MTEEIDIKRIIERIDIDQIERVYVGKGGHDRCQCGCSGKYTTPSPKNSWRIVKYLEMFEMNAKIVKFSNDFDLGRDRSLVLEIEGKVYVIYLKPIKKEVNIKKIVLFNDDGKKLTITGFEKYGGIELIFDLMRHVLTVNDGFSNLKITRKHVEKDETIDFEAMIADAKSLGFIGERTTG